MVKPHKRLRKLRKGAHDYASVPHTMSEHLSHGYGSYTRLHHAERRA
jgi:hypothetical protein